MQISVREAPLHCRRAYDTTGSAAVLTARLTDAPGCTLTTATGASAEERCFVSIARQDLAPFEWETTWGSTTLRHMGIGKEVTIIVKV